MKTLLNKFFLFGMIGLLLIAIPITMYFVKRQQDLRSHAAASSTLSFTPSTNSVQVGDQFDMEVSIDPGQNIVSYVKLAITYDPQKIEAVNITPSTSFPTTFAGPTISSGSASIEVGIGADVTQAIQAPTQVATVTFKALQPTATPAQISFDASSTQILSLSSNDQPGENVLSNTTPAQVTILSGGSGGNPTPTPTTTPTPTPTQILTPTPTEVVSANNVAPTCTGITVSPSASGSAPLSVTLQGSGSDSDGLVTKATFNFGDGEAQDVTEGLNLNSVDPQISHTYQNAGSFNASVVFTDNGGAVSQSCLQQINVSQAIAQGPTGGEQPTTQPTETPRPTLAPTGSSAALLGVLGGIAVTIIGAVFLLAL